MKHFMRAEARHMLGPPVHDHAILGWRDQPRQSDRNGDVAGAPTDPGRFRPNRRSRRLRQRSVVGAGWDELNLYRHPEAVGGSEGHEARDGSPAERDAALLCIGTLSPHRRLFPPIEKGQHGRRQLGCHEDLVVGEVGEDAPMCACMGRSSGWNPSLAYPNETITSRRTRCGCCAPSRKATPPPNQYPVTSTAS